MPDLLHQVKKGVWPHLISWFEALLRHIFDIRKANEYIDEIDKRLTLIPYYRGIKAFPKGIRGMAQITAGEYGDIMKVSFFFFFSPKYKEILSMNFPLVQ